MLTYNFLTDVIKVSGCVPVLLTGKVAQLHYKQHSFTITEHTPVILYLEELPVPLQTVNNAAIFNDFNEFF